VADAEVKKPEMVDVQAVYAGQRTATGGKLAHAWVVDGEELWFSKPTGGVVGGIYVLKMTPDHKSVFTGSPMYTMNRIEDRDQVAAWEIRHKSVARARRRAAAERKHKANGILDDATWSLDKIVKGLKTVDEVYVLSDLLRDHLLETYRKSR
jgi:hypothetical protein